MTFENFKKALEAIRNFDKTISALEECGICMIDSNICQCFWDLQNMLFTEAYGEDGCNLINQHWYSDNCPEGECNGGDEELWKLLESKYKQSN